MISQAARTALTFLIQQNGPDIINDPRRIEGMLSDLCPDSRRETTLISNALRERIPADLMAPATSVPPAMLRVRLAKRLEENLSVTPDAAVWAVETWATALGVMTENESTSSGASQGQQNGTGPGNPGWSQDAYTPPGQQDSLRGSQQGAFGQSQSNQQSVWNQQSGTQFGQSNQSGVWPPPVIGVDPGFVNTSGTGAGAILPPEIRGFNWGAFWLTFLWSIANKSYIGCLAAVPYVGCIMWFVMGFKGNEMAWQNRRWASIEEFKAVQRTWAVVGLILTIVIFFVSVIAEVVQHANGSNT